MEPRQWEVSRICTTKMGRERARRMSKKEPGNPVEGLDRRAADIEVEQRGGVRKKGVQGQRRSGAQLIPKRELLR